MWCYHEKRYRRIWIIFLAKRSWWRHQMETFSALLAICAGNSPVFGEFPAQRPVRRNFDIFFDLRLNKRLSKQSCGWWFETLSCPLWRQCNVLQSMLKKDVGKTWQETGYSPQRVSYLYDILINGCQISNVHYNVIKRFTSVLSPSI